MFFENSATIALTDAARDIIRREFQDLQGMPYLVPSSDGELLSQIARHLQSQGGNSHDVAIGFMLYVADSVVNPDDATIIWSATILEKCEQLMHSGALGKTLLADA